MPAANIRAQLSRSVAHPWGCGERIACPWGCRGWGEYRAAEILRNGDVLANCCGRRGRWHEIERAS